MTISEHWRNADAAAHCDSVGGCADHWCPICNPDRERDENR